jgi:acetyl esterase/lipase
MKTRFRLLALVSALFATSCTGAEPVVLRLWPDRPPGEIASLAPERDVTVATDRKPAGRAVVRISDVSTPTLTIYPAAPSNNTGAAVLVFPGGGYERLAIDIEGTEVCEWLNSIGVTGVVVKYRVPRREGIPQHVPPGQDAQRALSLMRQRAKDFAIDPSRIGVIGFSAGAHVAGVLSAHQDERLYRAIDAIDEVSCRPDFSMLIYPGYFRASDHGINPEVAVKPGKTPPTFLAMAQDDPVHVENALYYYLALQKAGVPAEMHLYPSGGHGFGLRQTEQVVTTWPRRAAEWMKASGWLQPPKQ